MRGGFIWEPTPELVEQANVTRLARRLGADGYRELHRISIDEPERFWPAVVDDLGIEFSRPWDAVVDVSRGPEWATWFTGGRVNVARAASTAGRRAAGRGGARLAERGRAARVAHAGRRRRAQVTQLAEALVELGVEPGDRVAIFMPMCPAVAVASHACAHIGAVQVPIFSGFAAPAIASRLEDSRREGRASAPTGRCAAASGSRCGRRSTRPAASRSSTSSRGTARRGEWPELVTRQPGTLPPLEVDSEAPYLLAYTSGTTGKPKGALHVQGGFLVSIAREAAYQSDVKAGDRVHFATDMGWIMGPWTVVGGGAIGRDDRLRRGRAGLAVGPALAARRVGARDDARLSPTLVRALIPHGDPEADLSSLRRSARPASRGIPDPYVWLFEHVGGSRAPIVNVSGGTEVGACFLSTVHHRADQAGRPRLPGSRPGHGRRRRRGQARCAARSASSSAGGRGPG